MAKLDNLLEGGQGSLGNLVFYKMHGRNYVRTKPEQYRDKKSPAQLAQRQRLQTVISFLRPFKDVLRITFASGAVGRSAIQAAQSYNMRNALEGEYPDIKIDKSKVLLSSGSQPLPSGASVSAHPDGLLIEWKNGEEATGSAASDTLIVIAFAASAERIDYKFTDTSRSEGRFVWNTKLNVSEVALPDVWIAFRSRQMTKMSDSLYAIKTD
jgi:hypothetical protein